MQPVYQDCISSFNRHDVHQLFYNSIFLSMRLKATVRLDGSTSKCYEMGRGIIRGCNRTAALFGVVFTVLLQFAFMECFDDVRQNLM